MANPQVMLITGSRKGIGEQLVKHYVAEGVHVLGCSRKNVDYKIRNHIYKINLFDYTIDNQYLDSIEKVYQLVGLMLAWSWQ